MSKYNHNKVLENRVIVEGFKCPVCSAPNWLGFVPEWPQSEFTTKASLMRHIGEHHHSWDRDKLKKQLEPYISKTDLAAVEKSTKTNQEKYGCNRPLQRKDICAKATETRDLTVKEKYGYDNIAQVPEVKERQFATLMETVYCTKQYELPNGKEVTVQGYEPFALDELFSNGYKCEDIVTDSWEITKHTGRIEYIGEDGNWHRYFPDIYIISENKIIEVKSTWTFKDGYDKNMLKREACISAGLDFEFRVYHENGDRIEN